ncbi:type II toxin-antitoxin system death-on-curing family toxin [Leptospira kanakyensis]|uniref:Type II toxin-antitoxin system death-on-curing family toxin n=1 Tax=Leptospira kanakyensis TaxID=2484968 RepID=A0A6N4Q8R4_9LEPT|nr:type II toxin-antitoxin system death-on-curing family toxin [Leptospira kanakyensis]MCW7471697.1 type II toxin-antitoxin system death-on-curing family toxin [Leptospira kanakyensis]MCW7483302.1 type II toxin-antitoxin system death-on-curing family toxin [Leptospira kanakyensis]TGK48789.1 type II toxin-antitoxin system death-on-curing family toxin [Leptospira kanakyensis]TGK59800.1 type II toxin-antitoxin system death-on-curing family toxin [Leptospira kanakyensis]TGK71954.1 type II toxin-an
MQDETIFLSIEDVILIHKNQIELYGGAADIRDHGLLESAINQPMTTFDGVSLHPSLLDKAAAYLFYLCKNHPFLDGNKRVALASSLVFLDINGYDILDPNNILYDFVIGVAEGKFRLEEIKKTLESLAQLNI